MRCFHFILLYWKWWYEKNLINRHTAFRAGTWPFTVSIIPGPPHGGEGVRRLNTQTFLPSFAECLHKSLPPEGVNTVSSLRSFHDFCLTYLAKMDFFLVFFLYFCICVCMYVFAVYVFVCCMYVASRGWCIHQNTLFFFIRWGKVS